MFIFANFEQKVTFEGSHFEKMGVEFYEFLWFVLVPLRILGESCFKAPRTNIFTIQMFIFAMYKKVILSNHSLRKWVWHLLNLISFSCLYCRYYGRIVLKVQKFCWINVFTIEMLFFCYFCIKNGFWAIIVSENGHGTDWILFIQITFIAGIRGKLF